MRCRVPICRKRYATKKLQTHTRAYIHIPLCVYIYILKSVSEKKTAFHFCHQTNRDRAVGEVSRTQCTHAGDDRWSQLARALRSF